MVSFFSEGLSPEFYARELIHELNITEWPIFIPDIAEKLGIKYIEEDFGIKGFDGALDRRGDTPILVINTSIPYDGRRNFTSAHEIGHFKIKGHDNSSFKCSAYDIMFYSADDKRKETEANRFAAELLMPVNEIESFIRVKSFDFKTIEEVTEKFRVSNTAAAIRLVEVIYEKCAVILSHHGQLVWSKRSKLFHHEIISKGRQIRPETYAYDFFNNNQVEDKFQELSPTGWLTSIRNPNEIRLFEHSRFFPELEMVLTLLYIPPNETIDDSNDEEEDY